MKYGALMLIVMMTACKPRVSQDEKVFLAGKLLQELQRKAEYNDSLKVEIFLIDEQAQHHMVQLPGGGFAFSKQYKEQVAANKQLAQLVQHCNVSVLAYGTLKSYVAREVIRKIPGKQGDSLQQIYLALR